MANAATSIAIEDLTGVSGVVALRAPSASDGYLEQAESFVHGYFTGTAARPSLHVNIEDAAKHKTSESFAESGASALAEVNDAARRIDASAHAFSSSNPDAVAAWGSGDFEKAVTLDPDFGVAWLGWAEKLQLSGNQAQSIDVATRALARKSLGTPTDRLKIELLLAGERHDLAGREKAMSELVRLMPNDALLALASAQVELAARNFPQAAERFRAVLRLDPKNQQILNSLGYAEGLAGDLDGARKTFEQYGQNPADKPNSLDSLGEVHFMLGRFVEAEKYFLAAHQANPAVTAGEDLLKAAYSRFLSGDVKGADQIAAQYFQFRANQRDANVAWREACWLYSTGRREPALAAMGRGPNSELAKRQAIVWSPQFRMPADLAQLKPRYEATSPTSDAQIRVLYAAALLAAGNTDQARALLQTWPMPWSPGDPLLQSIVLPETLELRKALGMPAR